MAGSNEWMGSNQRQLLLVQFLKSSLIVYFFTFFGGGGAFLCPFYFPVGYCDLHGK